jgi:hypothetical protein
VQLLCLGIIGEYLAKIYMEVKARPRFIIDSVVGNDAPDLGFVEVAQRIAARSKSSV